MRDRIKLVLEDEHNLTILLQIMRTHVKLALEFSNPVITPERKEEIRAEIKLLRTKRDDLLSQAASTVMNKKLPHQ